MVALTELFYLPSLEYFTAVLGSEEIILDDTEKYHKQTYRNRTSIMLANKVEVLSIPVLGGNKRLPYKEVKIDYGQKWKNVHLRGIQSGYGKAPFFEYFYPYFENIYQKNLTYLFDLNLELLTVCLKLLQLDVKLSVMGNIGEKAVGNDIRGLLNAKKGFETRSFYQSEAYSQLFGVNFVPNLSVVDLLFCEGPASKKVLQASQKK
ncbi:WbqC family protein [Cecembia calidifontis]|uniref:WbqC-like protein n=1 Tax=Cecembia calidifontis TaxID=1187080 RepID=A0A4Q7PD98_9BACT|nr:WbqC family protein [Cecembia calidifontis]RZS96772.1 WbqC-like protein [Cecembia calidifontis]